MKINNIQEIIKKIEWKSLKKEGGTCEYVPETIAELVTNNQNDREKMYWQYDNNVVVQSYLYDGAFYLIPFLIEMLKADDIIEKKKFIICCMKLETGQLNLIK